MNTPSPRNFIYGLVDPRTLLVRYVGLTTRGFSRPREHYSPKKRQNDNPVTRAWIDELLSASLAPTVVVLEVCHSAPKDPAPWCYWAHAKLKPTALYELERWWISYGKSCGWDLTNMTGGGQGHFGVKRPPEFSEKLRQRNLENNPLASPETRAKVSTLAKQRFIDHPEYRAMVSGDNSVTKRPDVRAKIAVKAKIRMSDPGYRQAVLSKAHEAQRTPEHKARRRVTSKQLWTDPAFRSRMLAAFKQRSDNAEWRSNIGTKARARWEDPEYRAKMSGRSLSETTKETIRNKAVERAQDPAYRRKLALSKVKYWKEQNGCQHKLWQICLCPTHPTYTLVFLHCKSAFTRRQAKNNARFCSKTCSSRHYGALRAKPIVYKTCGHCGVVFKHEGNVSGKFCTHACYIASGAHRHPKPRKLAKPVP